MLSKETLDIIHGRGVSDVEKAIKNLASDSKNIKDLDTVCEYIDNLQNTINILSQRW